MKKLISLVLIMSLMLFACFALAAGGGAGDPLVSLSYIRDTYMPSVLMNAQAELNSELQSLRDEMTGRLDKLFNISSDEYDYSGGFESLAFLKGGTLKMAQLTSFVLDTGITNIVIDTGEVIDVTAGMPVSSGSVLSANHRYFAAEDTSAVIRMYADSTGMVDGYYLAEPIGEIPSNLRFIDVPADHWANEYITYLSEKAIVNGVDEYSFKPGSTVTRATFVTILGRLAGVDMSQYLTAEFTDVEMDSWYGPYIAWASQSGIVTGYGNGKFGPGDHITREQMAVIIMRYADYTGVVLPGINESMAFTDQDMISDYALEAVELAQTSGIITGKPGGLFDPKGTALRSEISAVTYRLIKSAVLPA